MKIKLKNESPLCLRDIEPGDVFEFTNPNMVRGVFMKMKNCERYTCVRIWDGDVFTTPGSKSVRIIEGGFVEDD